jgi:hypothetical protein
LPWVNCITIGLGTIGLGRVFEKKLTIFRLMLVLSKIVPTFAIPNDNNGCQNHQNKR